MTQKEINLETVRDAQRSLREVRNKMLDLVLADELTSKDFEAINALDNQLCALKERFVPEYKQPTFAELMNAVNEGKSE